MNKYEAIHSFWNSFDIPAYEENTVPKDAKLPYITYEVVTNVLSEYQTALTAHVWDKSSGWKYLNSKVEEIGKALNGTRLVCDEGYIMLYRGEPFTNNTVDSEDNTIKGKYLNITADFITR